MQLFLSPGEDTVISMLKQAGWTQWYDPDGLIMGSETFGATVLTLLHGIARVVLQHHDGKLRTVSYLAPGCCFGQAAAFMPTPVAQPIAVQAVTRCEALFLSEDRLRGVLQAHPDVAIYLLKCSAMQVFNLLDQFAHSSFGPRAAHVSDVILSLPSQPDRSGYPSVTITQEELATVVGRSRVTVGKILKRLEQQGVLLLRRNRILIRDRQRLVAMSSVDAVGASAV